MRTFLFFLVTAWLALAIVACSSNSNDTCTPIGGVCVAASSCTDSLPYSCNSGICCAASATPGGSPADASAD